VAWEDRFHASTPGQEDSAGAILDDHATGAMKMSEAVGLGPRHATDDAVLAVDVVHVLIGVCEVHRQSDFSIASANVSTSTV